MNTKEYLDRLKKELGVESDYALHKALGITRSAISKLMHGGGTLSDESAIKVAELLGIPPGQVIIDMHIERSKAPEIRAAWFGIMEKFSTSFNSLIASSSPRRRRLAA
jgi:plasmid maintenance system antidote protein VapI